MSFFQRSCRTGNKRYSRSLCRTIVNPAINNNPVYNFRPVLPLGLSFSDELKAVMIESGFESLIDPLERNYSDMVYNDAEFSHWALPRSDSSRLWAFIYGEKLVSAQLQLNSLTTDTEFMRNYLNSQISELTLRMSRYYPDLDWEAQVQKSTLALMDEYKCRTNEQLNEVYNEIFCEQLFAGMNETTSLQNGRQYLEKYSTNNFVNFVESEEGNEFKDYLPSELEQKMINYFEFQWYLNSENMNASTYFSSIQSIENCVSMAMDALSKDMRNNFGLYFLESFDTCLTDAEYVVNVIQRAAPSVIMDNSEKNAQTLVDESLSLLDVSNDKISKSMAKVIARLFLSNVESADELCGCTVQQTSDILQSTDVKRLSVIHKALQIQSCLKHHSFTRLLFAVLLNEYPVWFAQFTAVSANTDQFSSANSSVFDVVVSNLIEFYSTQELLSSKMSALSIALNENSGCDSNTDHFCSFDPLVSDACTSPECMIVSMFNDAGEQCKGNGDIVGQLKYKAYCKYLTKYGSQSSWYKLLKFIFNPARGGFSGDVIATTASEFVNNSSNANELVFGGLTQIMRKRGLITGEKASSAKSNLMASVTGEVDELRNAAQKYEKARVEFESACKELRFNFEPDFDFDHARETYDPLNIHLAQFRYLSFK